MSKICKKRVHGNDKKNLPGDFKKCTGSLHLPLLFGFVDGTVRGIARPKNNQRQVYSGHKRVHALKLQNVTLPNGMIANLSGPYEGRRHDSFTLAESGLLNQLQ